jgi:hypothetical protein
VHKQLSVVYHSVTLVHRSLSVFDRRQKDLVPYLKNDQPPGNFTSGSVQRSHGWRKKVTNNPNINQDSRNQAISLSADGVPLFKDRNAGSAWPFVARSHNLPDGLSGDLAYVHMVAFEMSEHLDWKTEEPEHVFKVKRYFVHNSTLFCSQFFYICAQIYRESKSFDPLLTRMVDDLLLAQKEGYPIHDHSLPESSPDRVFTARMILLYVIGDYPGQAKLSGFSHQGTLFVHKIVNCTTWCTIDRPKLCFVHHIVHVQNIYYRFVHN